MLDLNYAFTLVVILVIFAMWSGKDQIAEMLIGTIQTIISKFKK